MTRRRPNLSRYAAVLGLGVLVSLGSARSVRAQGYTPDPYNGVGDYNIGYRDYLIPSYPNGYAITPGKDTLQGRSGIAEANQFQSFMESLLGGGLPSEHDFPSSRLLGPGSPHSQSYRQHDQQFNRVYTPNEQADKVYLRDRMARDQKYFEYLRETDPRKRAQLYREYTRDNLRAAHNLSQPRSARAATGSTPRAATPPPPPATRGTATNPATPGRSALPTPGRPSSNPSLLRRPSSTVPGRPVGSAPPPPSAGRTPRAGSAPPTPAGTGTGGLTPSEALRRSELLDRAPGATAPTTPDR